MVFERRTDVLETVFPIYNPATGAVTTYSIRRCPSADTSSRARVGKMAGKCWRVTPSSRQYQRSP